MTFSNGDLVCVWKNNKLLVSGTILRYLSPIQLKKYTPRYKQMRGCEIYIHTKQLPKP